MAERAGFWDEWRGSMDGRPTLFIKRLAKLWGCRLDLHKMVGLDDEGCFHTHPAHAIRLVLRGGYFEELPDGTWREWRPGMIGWVRPSFAHRVCSLRRRGRSFSLWLRFRKCAKTRLIGPGWAVQEQVHRAADTIMEHP